MSDIIGLDVSIPYPPGSSDPIVVVDKMASLKAAFVDRNSFNFLYSSEWDQDSPGFYALFSHIDENNHFAVYVGQTDSSLVQRLRNHNKDKDYWRNAVLFKHANPTAGFDRMETPYLEGLLVKAFLAYPNAQVMNKKDTGEKNFASEHKIRMNNVLDGALRILQLRGYYNSKLASTFHSNTHQQDDKVLIRPVRPSIPKLATDHNSKTNIQALAALRQLMREIKQNNPSQSAGYSRWSSDTILQRIIDVNPKTQKELHDISKVGDNIMSHADDVLNILRHHQS
jgi:hypothetical protein